MTDKLLWGEDMRMEKIKPIPKYIEKMVRKTDNINYPQPDGHTRYYAYFTKNDGELVKVTVAVKHKYKKWYCKQVAVHGVHSNDAFAKDMDFYYIAGYVVDWSELNPAYARWHTYDKWYVVDDNSFDPFAVPVNIDYILKQPEYKYSVVDKISTTNIFKYLRLYEQYPEGEYLIKLGFKDYATSKMILRKLHKDEQFRRWLIQHKNELVNHNYQIVSWLKAYSSNRPCAQVDLEITNKKSLRNYKDIQKMFANHYEQFLAYLAKQEASVAEYDDYLKSCVYLGLDMTLAKNRVPHDFKRWHDIRTDQYATKRAIEDEKQRKELYEKFRTIAEKYLPLQRYKETDYIAVIAKSPQDLIREGKALSHCVGRMNYDQKFAREESLIFFIRNANEPDTPLVTLEYSLSNKKILQCYGEHDHKPSANVLDYVNNKWLPFANRQLQKIQATA